MAKTHRGKVLRRLPNRGRGTCVLCHRSGVKLLYPVKVAGQETMVCKRCRSHQPG